MSWPFWLSDKTVREFAELSTYYQRQKCSSGILVYSKVRLMWIFARVNSLERGRQMNVGSSKMAIFAFFRSLYFTNLRMQGHSYYIVLCIPLVVLHWHRNRWPWMTLNGHFALKYVMSSPSNGSAFWLSEKLYGNLQTYNAYTISGKNVVHGLYRWHKSYGGIHWGYRTGSIKPVNCIYIQFSHMLFTDACKTSKIQE